jgi:hypothetical protein
VTTTVDGVIVALANGPSTVKLVIDPSVTDEKQVGYVNLAVSTIHVGPNALRTGDAVTYYNSRGDSIGGPIQGLIDGATYYVIRIPGHDDHIQLAHSLLAAHAGREVKLGDEIWRDDGSVNGIPSDASIDLPEEKKKATVVTKRFGAAQVDASADTIQLTGEGQDASLWGSTFRLGQAVRFDAAAGGAVAGLKSGQVYWVIVDVSEINLEGENRFTNHQVIRLARTEAEARAGIAIDLGASSGSGHVLSALHVLDSGRTSGVGVGAVLRAADASKAQAGLFDRAPIAKTVGGAVAGVRRNVSTTLLNGLYNALMDLTYRPKAQMAGTSASQVGASGALAITVADHVVTTTVGSGARLQSNADMDVTAIVRQRVQLFAEADVEVTIDKQNKARKPQNRHSQAASIAISVGVVSNTATRRSRAARSSTRCWRCASCPTSAIRSSAGSTSSRCPSASCRAPSAARGRCSR